MNRLVLAWFLMLVAVAPANAEIVPDLFQGEAIVTSGDDLDERARGVRLALTQVLVKMCGDDRVAEHPDLPEVLAAAESHIQEIEYEDRKLHRLFGVAWEQWRARTPALLPRFGSIAPAGTGDRRWSLLVSSKRNGEIVFVVFAFACAVWVAWRVAV